MRWKKKWKHWEKTHEHESEHTSADIEVKTRKRYRVNEWAPQQHQRQTLETQSIRKMKESMPQWCGYGCYRTYVKRVLVNLL